MSELISVNIKKFKDLKFKAPSLKERKNDFNKTKIKYAQIIINKYFTCASLLEKKNKFFAIPTTSNELLKTLKSTTNIAETIKYMKELNLILCVDTKYRFHQTSSDFDKARLYVFNFKAIKEFKEWTRSNNLEYKKEEEKKEKKNRIKKINKQIELKDIKPEIGCRLRIKKPENISKEDFNLYITNNLENTDILIHNLKVLVDKVNKNNQKYLKEEFPEYDCHELDNHANINVKYGKGKDKDIVKKISLRPSNQWVSAKKNPTENDSKISKKEVLDRYKFNTEYDIKSSVPRFIHSLNHGKWLSPKIDCYKMILDNLSEDSNLTREDAKKLTVSALFDGTDSQYLKHLNDRIKENKAPNVSKKDALDFRRSVKETLGEDQGTYIFIVEAYAIYSTVLELQKKYNKAIWTVYDSINMELNEEEKKSFKNVTEKLLEKNFKKVKKSFSKEYKEKGINNNRHKDINKEIDINNNKINTNNNRIDIDNKKTDIKGNKRNNTNNDRYINMKDNKYISKESSKCISIKDDKCIKEDSNEYINKGINKNNNRSISINDNKYSNINNNKYININDSKYININDNNKYNNNRYININDNKYNSINDNRYNNTNKNININIYNSIKPISLSKNFLLE